MAKILLVGDICSESQYLVDKVPAVDEIGVTKEVKHLRHWYQFNGFHLSV